MDRVWEIVTLPGKSEGETTVYPLVAIALMGGPHAWQAKIDPLALVVWRKGELSTILIEDIKNFEAQPAV